jgi:hypothetical protein
VPKKKRRPKMKQSISNEAVVFQEEKEGSILKGGHMHLGNIYSPITDYDFWIQRPIANVLEYMGSHYIQRIVKDYVRKCFDLTVVVEETETIQDFLRESVVLFELNYRITDGSRNEIDKMLIVDAVLKELFEDEYDQLESLPKKYHLIAVTPRMLFYTLEELVQYIACYGIPLSDALNKMNIPDYKITFTASQWKEERKQKGVRAWKK